MTRTHLLSVCLLSVIVTAACAPASRMAPRPPEATAVLLPTRGHEVRGTVQFQRRGELVLVTGTITGLTPGPHGMHIHEKGNCTAPDASSAGPHFNPHGGPHGSLVDQGRHAGDLGNIVADAAGVAEFSIEATGITLSADHHGVVGRSVIVHASADDMVSQPAGKSGARVACGLISKAR